MQRRCRVTAGYKILNKIGILVDNAWITVRMQERYGCVAFGVIRICNRLVFYVRGATFIRVIAAAGEILIFGFEQQHTPTMPHIIPHFVVTLCLTLLLHG